MVPDGFNLSLANLISANVHCGSGWKTSFAAGQDRIHPWSLGLAPRHELGPNRTKPQKHLWRLHFSGARVLSSWGLFYSTRVVRESPRLADTKPSRGYVESQSGSSQSGSQSGSPGAISGNPRCEKTYPAACKHTKLAIENRRNSWFAHENSMVDLSRSLCDSLPEGMGCFHGKMIELNGRCSSLVWLLEGTHDTGPSYPMPCYIVTSPVGYVPCLIWTTCACEIILTCLHTSIFAMTDQI